MDEKTLASIRDVCGKAIDPEFADAVKVANVMARKAGPHLHSVVELEIEKDMRLEDVMHVKEEVEHHLRKIHHMQTAIVDICSHRHLCPCFFAETTQYKWMITFL